MDEKKELNNIGINKINKARQSQSHSHTN
jgi:hypothetical protein